MFYYDHETTDDKEVVFKFVSEGKHWALSSLYDIKQDSKNSSFFNNHVRSSPLINDDDLAQGIAQEEKCQLIADRLSKRNRIIENQLVKVLELKADLF